MRGEVGLGAMAGPRLQVVPRLLHRPSRDLDQRRPDLQVRAHIHLNPSFRRVPCRGEQRHRDLPAAAKSLPGVQAFPRASQGFRPALAVNPIQRDRRGGEIRLLDPGSGGVPATRRAQSTVTLSRLATCWRYRVRRSGREISRSMSRATGQPSYFMPSRLTPNQTAYSDEVVHPFRAKPSGCSEPSRCWC